MCERGSQLSVTPLTLEIPVLVVERTSAIHLYNIWTFCRNMGGSQRVNPADFGEVMNPDD